MLTVAQIVSSVLSGSHSLVANILHNLSDAGCARDRTRLEAHLKRSRGL